MRLPSRWRLLAAFVFVFLCTTLLFTTSAFAQSITVVNSTSLPRLDKDGNSINKRNLTLTPEAVNLQDCLDDQRIRFTLQMAGFESNATVQAWAATSGDCKQETARAGGVQTCWQLGSNILIQSTIDVDLRVRSIMSGVGHSAAPVDNESLCGTIDLTTVNVHLLYFPPGQTVATVDQNIQVIVDTVGPAPPTGITHLPGNTRIQVSWANISGEGGLSELTGIKVYCDTSATTTVTPASSDASCTEVPNDSSTSSTDADDDSGDASDASADDAAITDAGTHTVCTDGSTTPQTSTCSSPNFVLSDGGKIFPSAEFNGKYQCGDITGNSGTTAVATEVGGAALINGTQYAVAVAATDKYGNVGPLSEIVCETPEITTDFWDDYRKAGGKAGGGCATTTAAGDEIPVGSISVFGLATLIVFSTAARRRRKKQRR